MVTYIMLLNWTDQGIKNVKDSPKRLDAVKKLAKDMGGEVKSFYMTLGSMILCSLSICRIMTNWRALASNSAPWEMCDPRPLKRSPKMTIGGLSPA